MREIQDMLRFWEARQGQALALATLVAARGSSYRSPGARMLIDITGQSVGGVSAGCIEEEVIACSREVLRTGTPALLTFDTQLRFGCHGAIDIFVEPLHEEVLKELRDCRAQRQSCRLETVLQGEPRGTRIAAFEEVPGAFVQTIEPALRLILIGDSSETAALRAYATLLGWDVLLFDARSIMGEMLDHRTAVVVATHNFGRDCAILRDLLPAGLKYLGLVGSRRRRDDLLFDVMHDDVAPRSALFAPAGLHLGAESPEEIALSIVAEIQCVFGAGTAQHLRHRKAPIHDSDPGAAACAKSAA
jgi:xanthine/CO dehydrogenase XdhC/CoxF family maturation factor